MKKSQRAFTLIELLVVIVIIGLLSSVATASFVNAQRTARDNTRKLAVSSIATAVETYYRDKHTFPGSSDSISTASSLCQRRDSGAPSNVSYSYVPNNNCSAPPFISTDPLSTWIPGLGSYMSSIPIDKQFRDANGLTYDQLTHGYNIRGTSCTSPAIQVNPNVACLGEVWTAKNSILTNQTRTYTYRHLIGGYIIYTRLEGTSIDTVSAVSNPLSGLGLGTLGDNVYAIQR